MISMTLVGTQYEDAIRSIFRDLNITAVNDISHGMFGNFKTLTYMLDIPDSDVVQTRKTLMKCVKDRLPFVIGLCEYGNWNRILLLFPRKIQAI